MTEALAQSSKASADTAGTTINIKVDSLSADFDGAITCKSKFQIKQKKNKAGTLGFSNDGKEQDPVDAQITHQGDVTTCIGTINVTSNQGVSAKTVVTIVYTNSTKAADLVFSSADASDTDAKMLSNPSFPPNGTGTGTGGGLYP